MGTGVVGRSPGSEGSHAPVFLVGSERSGSTMLRLMLDHHPEIAFLPESDYLVAHLPDGGGLPDVRAYREYLRSNDAVRDAALTPCEASDYPTLVNDLLLQKQRRAGKPVIGATVHWHFDRLPRVWPNARFIHLLRDGRDVARSVVNMGWAGNDYVAADVWLAAESAWDRLCGAVPESQRCEVRFEELVCHAEPQLRRICEFVGVAYSPDMLSYADRTTYERPNPKLTQQWKRKFAAMEIRRVEARIADRLVERGYERSGLPPLALGWLRRTWLHGQSRWRKTLFRAQRYGLALHLRYALSRRLRLRFIERRAAEDIRRIDRTHLK